MGRRCNNPPSRLSTKEKGATVAPFLSRSGSLTLLAALLLPALSSFLCHCAQSPLSLWDSDREDLSPSLQRRCLLARRPASVGALALYFRVRGRSADKKLGVSAGDTPSRQAERSSAFSRPFSF